MRKKTLLKTAALILAAAMALPLFACSPKDGGGDSTAGGDTTSAPGTDAPDDGKLPELDDWQGVGIKSSGSKTDAAVITNRGASVVYDDSEGKNVLLLERGDGYLELPVSVFDGVTNGYTVALRVRPGEGAQAGSKLFQANISGYGTGDVQWHDAPEMSLSLGGEMRMYVGGRTINGVYSDSATYNNGGAGDDKAYAEPGGHKTRYSAKGTVVGQQTLCDEGKWADIVLVVSSESVSLYVNGEELTLSETTEGGSGDISSTLEYLFGAYDGGENLIGKYAYTSVGNGVYSDIPNFVGAVSEMRVYHRALTADEADKLPDGAEFVWDFDSADIVTEQGDGESSDLTKYNGDVDVKENTALAVSSPDGKTKVKIASDGKGGFYYSVTAGETVVIENSKLGMVLREGDLSSGLSVVDSSVKTREIKETYETVTGPAATAENHCNETRFTLENDKGSFDFVIRVFDDGVAYKYENVKVGSGETLTVTDEVSEYMLPKNTTTWGYDPTGTYEGEYVKRSYTLLEKADRKLSTPMLANKGKYWMVFTEAGVYNNNGDFCASALVTPAGSASLGWHFGVDRDSNDKNKLGELGRPGHFDIKSIKTRNGFATPWRVAIISDDLEALALSTIVTDLNPDPDPALYADTSYIKPGRVAWSWWSEDDQQDNYDKHKEYVDFAAENGWEYVCLDANWRAFEGRIGELCKYAKDKGVGIFVWLNYLDMIDEDDMDALFRKWSEAGIVGLKTDYFESDAQNVLNVMENAAKCAAKYKLMILFHGCVIPYGEARTYPNVVSMEAVQGEENHKWSDKPTIENSLLYPFVRNVCGPMDYTPIATRIVANDSTTAFGLAMTVVYESGLQHLAYAASAYKTYTGLSFLNNLKVQWDESKLIEGYPGEYVTFARRSGEEWFIGAMTLASRECKVKLDFLGDGEYNAYIYGDNEDGKQLAISEKKVKKGDTLDLGTLLDRGGAAVLITKRTVDTTVKGAEEYNDPNYTYYEAEDENFKLTGAANIQSSALCSGGQKVGYIGQGAANTLSVTVTVKEAGKYKLRLWYCCNETRSIVVTVGDHGTEVAGLNSQSWTNPAMVEVEIELEAGANTIVFSNPKAYAPDIDRFAISNSPV